MPNKIKPKRSYTANSVPTTSDLETNELAINWADSKAFTKNAAGQIVSVTLGGGGGSGGGSLSATVTIPASGDQYWTETQLLLRGDAALDSSLYERSVTANAGAAISTSHKKFGTGSLSFASEGDHYSIPASPDLSFGTGDFTAEAWIRPTSYPANNADNYISTFLGRQTPGYHCWRFDLYGTSSSLTTLAFSGMSDSASGIQAVTAPYSFALDTWYHVAASRVSGVLYLFVNGVLQNSGGSSFSISIQDQPTSVRVGALMFDSTYKYQFFGQIDDVRITKGAGRYTATFTPPTATYGTGAYTAAQTLPVVGTGSIGSGLSWSSVPASPTATGTAGQIAYDNASGFFYVATATDTWKRAALSSWDPYFSSVSILLPMNGTNNSTAFVDAGPSALAVTANGDAKISTAQSKFGGASAVFDGTGDFLSVPNSAAFDFGSGDLAIEAWIYIASNATADPDGNRGCAICSTWAPTAAISGWVLGVLGDSTTTGTGLQFDSWNEGNATLYRATVSLAHSMWHHVAASVSGGTRRLYLNGTLVTGTTTTVGSGYTQFESLGNGFRIGNTANTSYPIALNGYIDDLRITKGSARGYTGSTITVPTAAHPTAGA